MISAGLFALAAIAVAFGVRSGDARRAVGNVEVRRPA
jgi:hypothetical protein